MIDNQSIKPLFPQANLPEDTYEQILGKIHSGRYAPVKPSVALSLMFVCIALFVISLYTVFNVSSNSDQEVQVFQKHQIY